MLPPTLALFLPLLAGNGLGGCGGWSLLQVTCFGVGIGVGGSLGPGLVSTFLGGLGVLLALILGQPSLRVDQTLRVLGVEALRPVDPLLLPFPDLARNFASLALSAFN